MVYLQFMTPNEVRAQYPKYRVVRYSKVTHKFEPIHILPSLAVYQVVKGIEELELIED